MERRPAPSLRGGRIPVAGKTGTADRDVYLYDRQETR